MLDTSHHETHRMSAKSHKPLQATFGVFMHARNSIFSLFIIFLALGVSVQSADLLRTPIKVEVAWLESNNTNDSLESALNVPAHAWSSQKFSPSLGYDSRTYWFKGHIRIPDQPSQEGWRIEIANAMLDRADVYILQNSLEVSPSSAAAKDWKWISVGDELPFANRPVTHRNFVLPIIAEPGTHVTLMIKARSSGPLVMPIYMWSTKGIKAHDHLYIILQSMYLGSMLSMFGFFVLLFVILKEVIYAQYATFIVAITGYCLCVEGLGYQYIWPHSVTWNDRSVSVFLWLCPYIAMAFFMELTEFSKRERFRVFSNIVFFTGALALAALICAIPSRFSIIGGVFAFLISAAVFAHYLIASQRRNDIVKYYYLAGSMPTLIGGSLLLAYFIGVLPLNFWTKYSLQIGSVMHVMLFTFGMSVKLSRAREMDQQSAIQRSINEELTRVNAHLEKSNAALERAMQEAKESTSALIEVKDRLRADADRRNRDKSRFLAQAVHDLRQPLQAISHAIAPTLGHMRKGSYSSAMLLMEVVQQASQVMSSQIDGLMDLSRLDSGTVIPDIKYISSTSILLDLKAQFTELSISEGVEFIVAPECSAPPILKTDQKLLFQVLMNLVDNSIKYSDPKKKNQRFVRVKITDFDSVACIEIEDNGIGISEADLADGRIFEPFYQSHNNKAEARKGVGLGLSIVNSILMLLPEHELNVASEAGVGSRFSIKLPCTKYYDSFDFDAESVPLNYYPEFKELDGLYIFLVEDDDLVRIATAAVLQYNNILCENFSTYDELASFAPQSERQPDLVISDFRLPECRTAIDVSTLIEDHWGNVPIIILSGDVDGISDDERLSGRLNFNLPVEAILLRKPISADTLLEKILQAFRQTPSNGRNSHSNLSSQSQTANDVDPH